MRKENTVKHPEKLPTLDSVPPVIETADEAVAVAKAQVQESGASPSSVMVSFRDGYVTADGEVHAASGITAAPKTQPKPAEKSFQVPATESYTPTSDPQTEFEVEEPSKDELVEKLEESEPTELAKDKNESEWDMVRPKSFTSDA